MAGRLTRIHAIASSDDGLASRENPETQEMRTALGAVAIAAPAVYWLYLGEDARWRIHREGDPDARCYPDRDQALHALRLAVIRCASYCLFLQEADGRFVREFLNWLPDPE